MMRRWLGWAAAALAVSGLTVLICLPAAWLNYALERVSAGRISLGDAQGTLWQGSAFLGGAQAAGEALTPLLPGRFTWRISPSLLLGKIDVTLENSQALAKPVTLSGSAWQRQVQLSSGRLTLPAERLAGLGAPLNTIAPSGTMQMHWREMSITPNEKQPLLNGSIDIELDNMASKLTSIKPLGAYRVNLDFQGAQAHIRLQSLRGPLLLSGSGTLQQGRMRFSGRAQAQAGQEATLAGFLGLLGPRRTEGGKPIIALEYNQ